MKLSRKSFLKGLGALILGAVVPVKALAKEEPARIRKHLAPLIGTEDDWGESVEDTRCIDKDCLPDTIITTDADGDYWAVKNDAWYDGAMRRSYFLDNFGLESFIDDRDRYHIVLTSGIREVRQ